MKRFWKIFLITLGSVTGLALVTVAVALWLVFTPARLTPIVAKQLPHFITCGATVERVELTFFSSFPRLGLRLDGVRLVNPMDGAPCDTLVRLGEVNAVIDAKVFLQHNELILSDISLRDGVVCLYIDSLGHTNFNVIKSTPDPASADSTAPVSDGMSSIARIDINDLSLNDINIHYVDDASPLRADIKGLSATLKASMNGDVVDLDLPALETSDVTVAYGGEEYLTDAPVSLAVSASADLAARSANIRDLALIINDLELNLAGMVRSTTRQDADADPSQSPVIATSPHMAVDLRYRFSDWALGDLLALVPPSMTHYPDGLDASGLLSSEGSVTGVYSKDSMPAIDADLTLTEGRIEYPAMLPWPLSDAAANIALHIDPDNSDKSYTTINSLSARTPRSVLRTQGRVDDLFGDPHADLVADLDVDLADMTAVDLAGAVPLLPASLPLTARGKVSGRVKADVLMSQLTDLEFDKMRLSGALLVRSLDARYDTVSVATPSARLDFALPNPKPSTRNTSFAAVSIAMDRFDASMGEGARSTAYLTLDGMKLAVETSNVLDDLNIPAVVCDFSFANLAAHMDDMSVKVASPSGKISMEPGRRNAATQRFAVVYNSGAIEGKTGTVDAIMEKLNLSATVSYDTSQDDLWQRLAPRGTISATGAEVNVPSLNYPVQVPTLAMDFTPRRATVHEARVVLDESDFSLNGTVDNIMPYFRGDSVLRAEFNFTSPVTNVSQLLALTNGIGEEKEDEEAAGQAVPEPAPADEFSGPYMVPKGVDVTLHAGIDEVLWDGNPMFFNIGGDVRIKDGALFISPRISFDSPATHGEFEFMYRTPDRNNLFAGVSLHLDRIEMQELITMLPDLQELMPMLRSFSGRGEFHAAAEGYMDSTYRFKMSTLRGAGSIGATNLTLKDDETFRKIAFLLKYKDEGVIRVDSMRAEFTVFRGEIDLYPFLLSIDRYKAVISGRHNLDQNFDYNISLVQSPLPFRVAVDVQGRQGDLKFKVLTKSRYPEFYRPKYEGITENRQLELRNIIRNSLLEGRKEDE